MTNENKDTHCHLDIISSTFVPDFIIDISNGDEQLVSIKPDGTVIIHKEGADKEAAKKFYESLEFEGKSLFARIEELEEENKVLKEKI